MNKDQLAEVQSQDATVSMLRRKARQNTARLQLLWDRLTEVQKRDLLREYPEMSEWFDSRGVPR